MRSWQRSTRTSSAEGSMTDVTIVDEYKIFIEKVRDSLQKNDGRTSHLQHERPQELKASARFWMLTYFFSLARACIWSSTEPCTCFSLKEETQRTWQESLKTCDHWDRKRHQPISFVECGTWRCYAGTSLQHSPSVSWGFMKAAIRNVRVPSGCPQRCRQSLLHVKGCGQQRSSEWT